MKLPALFLSLSLLSTTFAFANSVDDAFRAAERNQSQKEEQRRRSEEARKTSARKNQLLKAAALIAAKELRSSVAEYGSVRLRSEFSGAHEMVKLKTKNGLVCQVEFMSFSRDASLTLNIEEIMPGLEQVCARKAARDMAELRSVVSAGKFFNNRYEGDLDRAYYAVLNSCDLNQWEARGDCYDANSKWRDMGLSQVFASDSEVKLFK